MTPSEGALYLGIPNIIMVKYANKPAAPYEQHALALLPFKNVVWSIVGDKACNDTSKEVSTVKNLASRFHNISGCIMDDFFRRKKDEHGAQTPGFSPEELSEIKSEIKLTDRQLDLWVVLYDRELCMPVENHLKHCDVVTFWTSRPHKLADLEKNFEQVEKLAPYSRKVLGCYMYDYSAGKTMPKTLMEKQCLTGLKWLKEGKIEGIIFLASCICDLELEAVEWTRQWIKEISGEEINAFCDG